MKILQKTVASVAAFAFLLAAPVTILAATTSNTVKATPTESPQPTIEATVAPTPAATPAPQSITEWIMTHKKIDLGILAVVVAVGYVLSKLSKKNKQSPPEDQPKAEEEPKEEESAPPENQV